MKGNNFYEQRHQIPSHRMKTAISLHKFWTPFWIACLSNFFRLQYVWFLVHLYTDEILMKSQNVHGLSSSAKRQFQWLIHTNADIIFHQETQAMANTEYLWKKERGGDLFFSHGTCATKGTCILFKKLLDIKIHRKHLWWQRQICNSRSRYYWCKTSICKHLRSKWRWSSF